MPSVVDICNLALSHLGDRATLASIDPPEGSSQADHCAQWWPIVRDEALSAYDWKFASATTTPTMLDDSLMNNDGWYYAHARPADFLVSRDFAHTQSSMVSLYPGQPQWDSGTLDDGTPVFFVNDQYLSLRYTRRVSDPTRYTPGFVTAISYLLASYLAGPVIKGRMGVQTAAAMRQAWERLAAQASVTDANQSNVKQWYKPAGLRARGYGSNSVIVERGDYRHELPFWAEG